MKQALDEESVAWAAAIVGVLTLALTQVSVFAHLGRPVLFAFLLIGLVPQLVGAVQVSRPSLAAGRYARRSLRRVAVVAAWTGTAGCALYVLSADLSSQHMLDQGYGLLTWYAVDAHDNVLLLAWGALGWGSAVATRAGFDPLR